MGAEEEAPPEPLPFGTVNVFIQRQNYEKYGLYENDDEEKKSVVAYKLLKRSLILEECQSLGVMCDFHAFLVQLQALADDEVLLVADRERKYGDDWLLCLTSEAARREMAAMAAQKEAQREQERLIEEEREAKREAEASILSATFEDAPMIPRRYVSETEKETDQEVFKLTIWPERDLYKVAVIRDVSTFGLRCQFGDRDAENDKYLEFRSQKNPDFELSRREQDVGVSCAPLYASHTTQTTRFSKKNMYTIYDPDLVFHVLREMEKNEQQLENKQRPPSRVRTFVSGKKEARSKLADFILNAREFIEDALQQNETVDVANGPFEHVGDDDVEQEKGDDELKELRTFNDIVYSKNMSLAAISWHPTQRGVLAVAPVRNLTFDERNAVSGQALTSHILIWDFVDLIHPQLTLASPQEIACFAFSPDSPNVVAAGAINGQVLLWDISKEVNHLQRRRRKSALARSGSQTTLAAAAIAASSSEETKDDDGKKKDVPLEKKASSHGGAPKEAEEEDSSEEDSYNKVPVEPSGAAQIDSTHRRAVADLLWLPASCQVDFRGQILDAELTKGQPSCQFLTVSGDGQVLFWDTRYKDIAEGKLPRIGRRAPTDRKKDSNRQAHQQPWLPLYRVQLKRLEGVGELSLCKVRHGLRPNEEDTRSHLVCASEEGEIVFADWRATKKKETEAAKKANDKKENDPAENKNDDDDDDGSPEFVQWMAPDHTRPAVSLELSPLFPEVALSVGDWCFQLWKLSAPHRKPVFSSPPASSPLTAGCWSPTKPGTLFVARADGAVDLWDLTDSSYRPSATLPLAPTTITSMKFLPGTKQQLLAVGDKSGNLHVFDVPRNLWRPSGPNEKNLVFNFIQNETDRVDYLEKRASQRLQDQQQKAQEEKNNDDSPRETNSNIIAGENVADDDATNAASAKKISNKTEADADFHFSPDELADINEAYAIQQAAFADMLGITLPDDLKVATEPGTSNNGGSS